MSSSVEVDGRMSHGPVLAVAKRVRAAPPSPTRAAQALIAAVALGAAATPPSTRAADIVTIRWDAQGRFSHRAPPQASGFLEVCGELARGQAVRWRFEATAPLRFNIHHHEGRNVVYSEQLERSTGSAGLLEARRAESYCWMWDRFPVEGAAVTLELELELQRRATPR